MAAAGLAMNIAANASATQLVVMRNRLLNAILVSSGLLPSRAGSRDLLVLFFWSCWREMRPDEGCAQAGLMRPRLSDIAKHEFFIAKNRSIPPKQAS
jgi:hypothetical protein